MGKRACPLVVQEAVISSPDLDLEATVAVQAMVIDQLREANARLVAANAEQASLIGTLNARVAELERRLGKDSSNSSRPPSSDGLGKPPAPRQQRRGGGRAPGKQPGAPGAHLAQVGDPDEVVVHRPERCGGCGGDLTLAPVMGVEARQVFDLPEVRLWVCEHRAERRQCGCGQVTAGVFPEWARAAACYGPGVRGLGSYLMVGHHLPVERAAQVLGDGLGAWVSAGWLAGLAAEAAGGLGGFVERVREQLRGAEVAHFDETGARVAGRLHWVHSASTPLLSWFTVHAKRGVVAMDAAGVLPGFAGVAVHDGWSPYWRYPRATHALCAAHLLRELEGAAELPGQGWAAELGEWFTVACAQAASARDAGADRLAPAVLVGLTDRYDRILAKGRAANPPPPRRPGRRRRQRRSPAACLLGRLEGHRDEVVRFLADLRVPPTNNLAERDIRMVKLQQKISGCWRTLDGAQAFLTVRSYVATARKHGINPLIALRRLFEGNPWMPAPAPS
jgi:transposase